MKKFFAILAAVAVSASAATDHPGSPQIARFSIADSARPMEYRSMTRVTAFLLLAGCQIGLAATLRFNRDVQPILSDHCYRCHGPDKNQRKGELRLDQREEAVREAIVPGRAGESELMRRIHETDPDEVMPPPEMKKPLSDDQKRVLERWINEGAQYERHWAFIPPERPPLPPGSATNPIDRFVARTLAEHRLEPSPPAPKPILLRRILLDLTGIAPTPEELDAFVADEQPGAVVRAIDRAFASPRTANTSPANGWTWPATPIPTATSTTRTAPCGRGATGSSTRSTRTSPSTSSRSSSWPATCCRTRRSSRGSPPASTATTR